jgi:pyrroline-5-carboxylate reductase
MNFSSNPEETIGFIGVGTIASAVVTGLCQDGDPSLRILLSPRNQERGLRLEASFPQAQRAESNQQVVDSSSTVFLALRPNVAQDILEKIAFRADQTIISLIPTVPIHRLQKWIQPARRIFKILPLPYTARRLGTVPYFPADPIIAGLISRFATPIPMPDEHQLHVIWAITGLISPYYRLMEETCRWCVDKGAAPEIAAEYTASMYHSLAAVTLGADKDPFAEMAKEAATPGGLNEMAVAMMEDDGVYRSLRKALDAIWQRFQVGLDESPDPAGKNRSGVSASGQIRQ